MSETSSVKLPGYVKIIVLALPILAFFFMCEWGAELYLKGKYGDDFDLRVQATGEMAPSSYQLWEHPHNYWNLQGTSRFNNLGFRRFEDTEIEKQPGTVRIFFMGGSGALGAGANRGYPWFQMSGQAQYSADESISAYLERHLSERYPNKQFEVINAATNWAQLHQQIIHYYRKIRYLQPDLVISMDGQNDALVISDEYLSTWDQARVERLGSLASNFRVKMRPVITRSHFLFLVAATAFGEKRSGRQPINQGLVDEYESLGKPDDFEGRVASYARDHGDILDRGVDFYVDHLRHFKDALDRDRVAALFVQQPELIADESKPLTEIERALQNYLYRDIDPYAVNFFRMVEQSGNRMRQTDGFPYHSFLNIFGDDDGEVYVDYTHLTPHGNDLLAARLVEIIELEHAALLQ